MNHGWAQMDTDLAKTQLHCCSTRVSRVISGVSPEMESANLVQGKSEPLNLKPFQMTPDTSFFVA
jgi:hypothetical protein